MGHTPTNNICFKDNQTLCWLKKNNRNHDVSYPNGHWSHHHNKINELHSFAKYLDNAASNIPEIKACLPV